MKEYYENLLVVWDGNFENHSLHSVHVDIIELANAESFKEILNRCHAVAASQLGAWVI